MASFWRSSLSKCVAVRSALLGGAAVTTTALVFFSVQQSDIRKWSGDLRAKSSIDDKISTADILPSEPHKLQYMTLFWRFFSADRPLLLEESAAVTVDVKSPTYVPPFITVDGCVYRLMGAGVRAVTFLKMQVYMAGLYVSEDHLKSLSKIILNDATQSVSSATVPDDSHAVLTKHMTDFASCKTSFAKISQSKVDFCLRISPLRKTDFTHIRDGFIRAINRKIKPDNEFDEDTIHTAISDFKRLFPTGKKLNAGDEMLLFFNPRNNSAHVVHNKETISKITLPENSLVYRGVIMGYLCGDNIVSEPLRQEFVTSTLHNPEPITT